MFGRFIPSLAGLVTSMFINTGQSSAPIWTQKTVYKPLPTNHEQHKSKAEEKRARKAAKLRAMKGQQHAK